MRLGIAGSILSAIIKAEVKRSRVVPRSEWMDCWSRECLKWAESMLRADAEMFPSDDQPASAGRGEGWSLNQ
jgi:hypothetical protein